MRSYTEANALASAEARAFLCFSLSTAQLGLRVFSRKSPWRENRGWDDPTPD